MKKSRRSFWLLGIIVLVIVVSGVWSAFWYLLPLTLPDPLTILNRRTPVRIWRDCQGRELALERTYNGEWRFEIALEEVPDCVVDVMLAVEDRNFFKHSGIDWLAVWRAACQNFFSGRIISGASTISMQLAGLSFPPGKRTLWKKIRQVIAARSLELRHSKKEILQAYFNFIPFGGNLYGIEAASRYYFCRRVSKLQLPEAAALCGIPQRPNHWRPDYHLKQTLIRRNRVLDILHNQKVISGDTAEKLKSDTSLKWRDFQHNPWITRQAPEIWEMAVKKINPYGRYDITTCLDAGYSSRILEILRRRVKSLPQVRDSAAVVMDSRTGKVLTYIGSLDYDDPLDGQVDAASSHRAAGSTLKPFIYAECVEAGFIATDTRLLDSPLRFDDNYAPLNFDRNFYGPITAEKALADSLNTPAIRLAKKLGVARLYETLERCRLSGWKKQSFAGLSEIFGVSGYTLLNLTSAYSMLAREGIFIPASFAANQQNQKVERVFQRGTAQLISQWLRSHNLSGGIPFAWKTGTSNNHGDAWCLAYTPDYTVGVWCGNKSGARADCLVGGTAAAPIADEIMLMLYRGKPPCLWPAMDDVELRTVCAVSGLRPNLYCRKRVKTSAVKNIPLEECRSCSKDGTGVVEPINIISPKSTDYYTDDEMVVLPLIANRNSVSWFINGEAVKDKKYCFHSGSRYLIRAVSLTDDGEVESAEITISVSCRSGQ